MTGKKEEEKNAQNQMYTYVNKPNENLLQRKQLKSLNQKSV
jgi:hypothetical protein